MVRYWVWHQSMLMWRFKGFLRVRWGAFLSIPKLYSDFHSQAADIISYLALNWCCKHESANWPRAITATQCFVNLFLSSVLFLQGWIVSFFLCYLLAFPYNIKMPPLSHTFVMYIQPSFFGGGEGTKYCSSLECS